MCSTVALSLGPRYFYNLIKLSLSPGIFVSVSDLMNENERHEMRIQNSRVVAAVETVRLFRPCQKKNMNLKRKKNSELLRKQGEAPDKRTRSYSSLRRKKQELEKVSLFSAPVKKRQIDLNDKFL